MPLKLHRHIEPDVELGIWQIEEPEEWFLERLGLAAAEQQQLARIKGRRRVEWLAVRQLVHQMSGRKIRGAFVKDEYGKPHLEGSSHHISISHSHELAAAIAAPVAAGIDVQFLVPRIERLAHKFLGPEELASLQDGSRIEHLHVYWGAKEALYKAYGRRSLDFRAHIHLDPFSYRPEGGQAEGRILKEGYEARFRVQYFRVGDYMLVYAMLLV
ncbi:MAG: 4'-phosphopantetheinyl transferase superfamily protein [Phaeodactylibacter sp.]|nr:4'-phosphopantetheinyl transferase superfamily protein [Phaeodactylibacter sp.]MCB9289977.1 4'-phosphopantetheinyl transferase superfamily protein [Lewinellaceae bacterium]